MPIQVELTRAPSGRAFVRTLTSGNIGADDVTGLLARLSVPEYVGMSVLSVFESDTRYSPEARMVVRKIKTEAVKGQGSALVVKSAPQRIVLGFMLKLGSLTKGNHGIETKVFDNEDDAVSWLETIWAQKP